MRLSLILKQLYHIAFLIVQNCIIHDLPIIQIIVLKTKKPPEGGF